MVALRRRGFPGPDEKLKRIVGGQINALLKGGYDAVMIRHFAIELALSWDNAKGHQRMLGLRQAVLQKTAELEYEAHDERKNAAADFTAVDPAVAVALINAAKRRLTHNQDRAAWTVRCSHAGCLRTALYANPTCAEHTKVPA
jgi:hypothetical protein